MHDQARLKVAGPNVSASPRSAAAAVLAAALLAGAVSASADPVKHLLPRDYASRVVAGGSGCRAGAGCHAERCRSIIAARAC